MLKKYWRNLKYIIKHKWYVFVECRNLGVSWHQSILHDMSKFSITEFVAYTNYFQTPSDQRTHKIEEDFDKAWLHHIHHNPHHWQYWVLTTDEEGVKVLRMPEKYVREMVADWRGVGLALGKGRNNAVEWYERSKNTMALHPQTRSRVEQLLGIKPLLDVVGVVAYPQHREIGAA